jgi:hypothetical protein
MACRSGGIICWSRFASRGSTRADEDAGGRDE